MSVLQNIRFLITQCRLDCSGQSSMKRWTFSYKCMLNSLPAEYLTRVPSVFPHEDIYSHEGPAFSEKNAVRACILISILRYYLLDYSVSRFSLQCWLNKLSFIGALVDQPWGLWVPPIAYMYSLYGA